MEYITLNKVYRTDRDQYEAEYIRRFASVSAVHLDFTVHGHPAFFCVTEEAVNLVYAILNNDRKASALNRRLPGAARKQYANRCLIDEVVVTNKIEGVHSSRREIGSVLEELKTQSIKKNKETRFDGMVMRYLKLLDRETIPLSECRDVRSLYDEIALPEVLSESKDSAPDGEIFRKDEASIYGNDGKIVHSGTYPEWRIIEKMQKALSFLNNEEVNSLFRISIFHYMLEYIHPFYDGNGRLGRFIVSYMLAKEMNPLISYRFSETVKENLTEYYRAFRVCNERLNRGDLTPFLLMMLRMIRKSGEYLKEGLEEKKADLDRYAEIADRIPGSRETEAMETLYYLLIQAALFSEAGIPEREIEPVVNKKKTTVMAMLKAVDEQGLLITGRIGRCKAYKINLEKLDEIE